MPSAHASEAARTDSRCLSLDGYIQPDNVLVSKDGRARVLDFGLARRGDPGLTTSDPGESRSPSHASPAKLTMDGMISGTPGYMSPEQLIGEPVDARSDQFSFCAALFEALFEKPPFAGTVVAEIVSNTVGGHVQPRPAGSHIPEEIHHALLRGLSTNPDQRYPNMDELLEALFLETTHSVAAAASSRQRFVRAALFAGIALTAVMQAVRARHPLHIRQMIGVSVLMLTVILSAGLSQRQRLLRNAFHRRMWLLFLVPSLQNLALRLIGWHLGLTFQQVGPLELAVMAGTAVLGGAYFFRSFLWLAALLGVASAAWAGLGQAAAPFVSPMYSVTLGWMLWAWTTGGTAVGRTANKGNPGDMD